MKMLRIAAGLALTVCFAMFAACGSLPTVQQQFQAGCTIVNGDLQVLSASPLLNQAQKDLVNGVQGDPTKPGILPTNEAICKAGGQLNVTDLKAFHDSLLPAAIEIVQAVPAIPNQPAVLLGLQAFGPMLQALIDQVIVATAPSAPAASSAPLAGAPLK